MKAGSIGRDSARLRRGSRNGPSESIWNSRIGGAAERLQKWLRQQGLRRSK
jgi:hypothetical protein